MDIEWTNEGNLLIKTDGCYDCSGEEKELTLEEINDLLSKRPILTKPTDSAGACSACNGKGTIFVPGDIIACPECKGKVSVKLADSAGVKHGQ